jgi:GxxExxY protein
MDEFEDVNELTQRIIGCAMRVSSTLGVGFLEKVYENALVVELRLQGIDCQQQHALQVMYEGVVVGDFICDIVVEDRVVLELKSCRVIEDVHQAQLLNYLRATGVRVGLLLNFGTSRLGIKRMVL